MRTAFVSVALAAFAQLSLAAALPAAEVAENAIEKRAVTHLFVCDSANFQGRCENLQVDRGSCLTLFNNWGDTISSLGPDSGTTCTVYENNDCQGRSLGGIVSPGIFNLNDFNFNDIISSFRCS